MQENVPDEPYQAESKARTASIVSDAASSVYANSSAASDTSSVRDPTSDDEGSDNSERRGAPAAQPRQKEPHRLKGWMNRWIDDKVQLDLLLIT